MDGGKKYAGKQGEGDCLRPLAELRGLLVHHLPIPDFVRANTLHATLATRLLGDAVKADRIRLVDPSVGYRSWRYVPHWG